MSRYFIIDIEHIKSRFKSEIAAQKAIDQLVYNPLVLSEEESLAKFKEVWEAGKEAGMDCTPLEKNYSNEDYEDMEKYWEEDVKPNL